MLGQPEISGADGRIRLRSKKGQALLWYLGAHWDRAFTRAQLSTLLWEQAEESDARHSLSMTLRRLRANLPVWPLAIRNGTVGWDSESDVRLDTARFQQCIASATGEGEAGTTKSVPLVTAVSLWRGPLAGRLSPASEPRVRGVAPGGNGGSGRAE